MSSGGVLTIQGGSAGTSTLALGSFNLTVGSQTLIVGASATVSVSVSNVGGGRISGVGTFGMFAVSITNVQFTNSFATYCKSLLLLLSLSLSLFVCSALEFGA